MKALVFILMTFDPHTGAMQVRTEIVRDPIACALRVDEATARGNRYQVALCSAHGETWEFTPTSKAGS